MLALSPLFPAFGLPLDDGPINYEHNWNPNESLLKEWESLDSFEHEIQNNHKNSTLTSSDSLPSTKKLSHNASERERRQKLNGLYSTLRSMLPDTDQKKKLSTPSTISNALKYIPQLQDQVERLAQRKEEILSILSKPSNDQPCRQKKDLREQSLPTVSTSQIGDREVVIQICTSAKTNKSPFSQVLQILEEEQLQINNTSTLISCDDKFLYMVHVHVKETQRVQYELLMEKIISLC